METISYTFARANLAQTMEHICKDHAAVVITRAAARPVVMLPLEVYEAMETTNYLMSNPHNAARLLASIDEVEKMIAKTASKNKKTTMQRRARCSTNAQL